MSTKYVELERVRQIVAAFADPSVKISIMMTLEGCPDFLRDIEVEDSEPLPEDAWAGL